MHGRYTLDDAGNAVLAEDLMAWARWFETAERHTASDEIGNVHVSTIFLGLDHNFSGSGAPVLWETMVFGGTLEGKQERYTSREDALAGHAAMVERVKSAQLTGGK